MREHLEDSAPLTAQPAGAGEVPMFVLATGSGVVTAAALGLPVVLGGPFLDSPELPDRLAAYRRRFQPHRGSVPQVIVSVDALIADTDEEARELALPEVWAMARSRTTGLFEALEPVSRIRASPMSEKEAHRVGKGPCGDGGRGSLATVRRRIEELIERTGAHEVLATGATYDREALRDSDRELAQLLAG